ncbi:uncharacterized protein LOC129289133 [Prosopis cineraria]|uniref:uncharacterized protein LOC129289133 n=1 Tax=Prosopis cineraria TaxID=364024 RepID=UPI00240F488E|nr:uncharacterized protein LOC129289133 [Prosopis cineraria]
MKSNTIIFLCSLHYKLGKEMKKTIDLVMRTHQNVVLQKHRHELKDPTWIEPKSHRQLVKTNLCGLYVMRYMLNIITLGRTEFTKEMFDNSDAFSEVKLKTSAQDCLLLPFPLPDMPLPTDVEAAQAGLDFMTKVLADGEPYDLGLDCMVRK